MKTTIRLSRNPYRRFYLHIYQLEIFHIHTVCSILQANRDEVFWCVPVIAVAPIL